MTQISDRYYRTMTVHNRWGICLAIITVLILLVSACGKKAPPVPPTYMAPPVISELQIVIEDNTAGLQWLVPKWEGIGENALAGFYVYQSKIALSGEDCPDCPLRFKKIASVRMGKSKARGLYSVPLEKGFRYAFKVSAYTEGGSEGETSDRVTVELE